jgi:hypothetical protein
MYGPSNLALSSDWTENRKGATPKQVASGSGLARQWHLVKDLNKSLQALALRGNGIGPVRATAFAETLRTSSSLQRLGLGWNRKCICIGYTVAGRL